jgi:hypothetical protein
VARGRFRCWEFKAQGKLNEAKGKRQKATSNKQQLFFNKSQEQERSTDEARMQEGASSGAFATTFAAFAAAPSPFSPYCQLLLAAAELEAASTRPCPT